MKEVIRAIDKYQPLWGSWKAAELTGQDSGCEVYRVYKEEWGKQYISTVKLLSFFIGESDIKEAQAIGLDPASMPEYYKSLVGNVQNEIELMYRLRGNSNIVTYEDHAIYEKKDRRGWDVLIRMEYLKPLAGVLTDRELERPEVAKLGIDICKALEACATEGIIHRDVKDSSIFVSPKGEYKLGSFSMAKELMKGGRTAMNALSPLHMAPELYKEQGYDASVDIYSLGIVMYKLLNRGRLPFLPLPPGAISVDEAEKALARRMEGEELVPPVDAGESLGAIILKACSYERKDRYKSPAEFRQKLERFLKADSKAAKLEGMTLINATEYTDWMPSVNRESEVKAAYEQELGKIGVVELAASVDKINNDLKQKKMRLLKNAAIWTAVAVLAFIVAFIIAYEVEPDVEEPVAEAAIETVQPSPLPDIASTPGPEPGPEAKSPEEYYEEGLKHLENNRYGMAIFAFEEAKRLGYDGEKLESRILTAKKRAEVQKLYSNAVKYFEQQEYERAITAFTELVAADAAYKSSDRYSESFFKLAEKHNLSGMKYYNAGKLEQAIEEFDTAVGFLERMKKDLAKFDLKKCNERYGIYSGNKSRMLEKISKIDECIKLADERNKNGVKYFSEGYLYKAKEEFEAALENMNKIELVAPAYQDTEYIRLKKICEDNLKRIQAKL